MPAGQMGGVPQPPGAGVEGAGRADDDAVQIAPDEVGGLHGPVERVGDLPHHGLTRSTPRGAHLELPDHVPGDVRDGGPDPLGRHIEPGDVCGARVDRVQLGVGPRPPLGGPGRHHQPRRLQPCEQLRRGRLGQPGELPDPGTGQGPVLQEQIEGGAVVHGAEYARRSRGSTGHDGSTCPSGLGFPNLTVRKVSYRMEGR